MTERKINLAIIEQLRMARLPQSWLARKTKLQESIISMIINGRMIPDAAQREKIAKALRMQAEQLFN